MVSEGIKRKYFQLGKIEYPDLSGSSFVKSPEVTGTGVPLCCFQSSKTYFFLNSMSTSRYSLLFTSKKGGKNQRALQYLHYQEPTSL